MNETTLEQLQANVDDANAQLELCLDEQSEARAYLLNTLSVKQAAAKKESVAHLTTVHDAQIREMKARHSAELSALKDSQARSLRPLLIEVNDRQSVERHAAQRELATRQHAEKATRKRALNQAARALADR